MKKKKTNIIVKIFKSIYKIIDTILLTPISKIAYFIKDKFTIKSGRIDKVLNNSSVLIYVSLVLAFACFVGVDKKIINLNNNEALVLSNISVSAEYNDEKYVVEGIPETVDLILMGKKSELYLAEQMKGEHKVSLDLSDYEEGTHKVKLNYNTPISKLDYSLDPSTVTVVIYPKISEVRELTADLINTDKLDDTLVVTNIILDRDDVMIKSYKEKLDTIANVKAIVDVSSLNVSASGTYTIENVKLVAYDDNGKEVENVEIVPETVTATVTITSPSKVVPLKVVPKGEVKSGSAISSISSSVTNVVVYADESVLNDINYIEVEIDVSGLNSNKTYQKTISKPAGARSISETSVTITVSMEEETSMDFEEVTIETRNLDSTKFKAQAATKSDATVTVSVKGVKSLLDALNKDDIKAYVDLSEVKETGVITVPVYVEGNDVKLSYTSKTKNVKIEILEK